MTGMDRIGRRTTRGRFLGQAGALGAVLAVRPARAGAMADLVLPGGPSERPLTRQPSRNKAR